MKHVASALSVGLWAAILATCYGWAFSDYRAPARRSYNEDKCIGSGGKCYASEQCCQHFVCAAFDDLFGLNPNVPGFCVREKDLHPCESSMDCAQDARCTNLGRGGMKYCVDMDEEGRGKPAAKPKYSVPNVGGKGGLGEKCEGTDQCQETTSDGNDQLCCQKVKRYRQKTRTVCDRVTAISACLP